MQRTESRRLVLSGARLEPEIGFARAVQVGAPVAISGTAPIAADGTATVGRDVYVQTKRCLEIIEQAITSLRGSFTDIIRTWVLLTDIRKWKEAARAHGERFSDIRPAFTFVQVSGFIDPEWHVEVEADTIISTDAA